MDLNRRDFLKLSGAGLVGAVALSAMPIPRFWQRGSFRCHTGVLKHRLSAAIVLLAAGPSLQRGAKMVENE